MRLAVLLSHPLHSRNWQFSGMLDLLRSRGHEVVVLEPLPPTWIRVRRTLRLMTQVNEELRVSTYAHKATLLTGTRRLQANILRAFRECGDDLGKVAQRWEGLLPVSRLASEAMDAIKPDLVLWPTLVHQDSVENDYIKATKRRGIPVLGAPASWDNLTTKGLFLVRPDRLMVWGEASKRHAMVYHGFQPSEVAVTGPPQFTPYESGVTKPGPGVYVNGTSIHYWRDEDVMVEQMRAALPGVPIIHSLHPRRRKEYPAIDFIKQRLDESFCLVAAFSTTVIEAALCGRPSVLVGYGAGAQGEAMEALGHKATGVLDHAKYEHMAEITRFPGVSVARSLTELCSLIRAVRDKAPGAGVLRRAALDVAYAEPGIHDRIVAAIEGMR